LKAFALSMSLAALSERDIMTARTCNLERAQTSHDSRR
jgi:hypothetical protein